MESVFLQTEIELDNFSKFAVNTDYLDLKRNELSLCVLSAGMELILNRVVLFENRKKVETGKRKRQERKDN